MEDERQEPLGESSDSNLSAEAYEVVHGSFFSQCTEPAVTFGKQKVWVNSVCLEKFPQTDYVQILINKHTKVLALHPSREDDRNSLPWCSYSGGKRKPRRLPCPVFFAKIYELMGWNSSFRYRAAGTYLRGSSGELLAFDLQSATAYPIGAAQRYIPRFPADWRDQFGTPEHGLEPLIHLFDEYAVFELEPSEAAPDISKICKSKGEIETW